MLYTELFSVSATLRIRNKRVETLLVEMAKTVPSRTHDGVVQGHDVVCNTVNNVLHELTIATHDRHGIPTADKRGVNSINGNFIA